MSKWVLEIDGNDKDIQILYENKELVDNADFYFLATQKGNILNDFHFELIKQALSSASYKNELRTLTQLYKMLKGIFVTQKSNSRYFSENSNHSDINSYMTSIDPNINIHTKTNARGYLRYPYTQIYFIDFDNSVNSLKYDLVDIKHDHQAMFKTNATKKISLLNQIKVLKNTDIHASVKGMIDAIAKLNNTLPATIGVNIVENGFDIHLSIDKSSFLVSYKDFLQSLEKNLQAIKSEVKNFELKSIVMKKFEGFLNKVEETKKSYVYLVKTGSGEVGFLGLNIKKVRHNYKNTYSLKPVKSLSAALIFEEKDYKMCGISELTNKNLYSIIETVECSQVFKMENKSFEDEQIQAFASNLEKLKIESFFNEQNKDNGAQTQEKPIKKVNKL